MSAEAGRLVAKTRLVDELERLFAYETGVMVHLHEQESQLAEYQPPQSIRLLMAHAAADVLEAFERGQVVGKESAEIEREEDQYDNQGADA